MNKLETVNTLYKTSRKTSCSITVTPNIMVMSQRLILNYTSKPEGEKVHRYSQKWLMAETKSPNKNEEATSGALDNYMVFLCFSACTFTFSFLFWWGLWNYHWCSTPGVLMGKITGRAIKRHGDNGENCDPVGESILHPQDCSRKKH